MVDSTIRSVRKNAPVNMVTASRGKFQRAEPVAALYEQGRIHHLRGLGARAPYFHNGEARDLTDVVRFYNQRFNIGFTAEEIRKVVLFLQQT